MEILDYTTTLSWDSGWYYTGYIEIEKKQTGLSSVDVEFTKKGYKTALLRFSRSELQPVWDGDGSSEEVSFTIPVVYLEKNP